MFVLSASRSSESDMPISIDIFRGPSPFVSLSLSISAHPKTERGWRHGPARRVHSPFFFFFPPPKKKKKKKKKKINKTVDPTWWFSSHLSSCYSSVFSSSSTFSLTELPCVWETQRRPRRSPNLAEWVIRLRERHTHTQRERRAVLYNTSNLYRREWELSAAAVNSFCNVTHSASWEIWNHHLATLWPSYIRLQLFLFLRLRTWDTLR